MTITRTAASICCAVVLGALALSGCDAVGPDAITLQKEVDFRFEFSTAGSDAGEAIQVNALETVDLSDLLVAEGLSRDDVILVNVRSVSLERITPVGTTLGVFERAAISLTATGVTAPTVANADDLPSAREVGMNVVSPGITQVVVQPRFGARLTIVPRAVHSEDYVLAVNVDLAIEAEGI